jgi:1-acyl-sn-glycerol-3-phosphate acyltransferase
MFKTPLKVCSLIIWTALWYPPVWIAKRMNKQAQYSRMIQLCSKGMLFITGVRLRVTGSPSDKRPLLLVSNHLSYLDVIILSSQMPVRFTPKSEIEKWPVVGNICHLCNALFIDRSVDKVKEMKEKLHKALSDDTVISLFPEATTGNGIRLHPFKSGLFSLAEGDFGERQLTIQPAAITYTHICKLPIDITQWPDIAWYGDMDFIPHLFNVLSLGPIDAELVFLPPLTVDKKAGRKELSSQCQAMIQETLNGIRERRPAVYSAPTAA